jgi:hypothetical protein
MHAAAATPLLATTAPPPPPQADDKACQTRFEGGRRIVLQFSGEECPERIVFVLKELSPENWINNGSSFNIQVRVCAACASAEELGNAREPEGCRVSGLVQLRAGVSTDRHTAHLLLRCGPTAQVGGLRPAYQARA